MKYDFKEQARELKESISGESTAESYFTQRKREIKSKRVQLVMKPSLYDRAKERALIKGLSLNGYIADLIKEDLEREVR